MACAKPSHVSHVSTAIYIFRTTDGRKFPILFPLSTGKNPEQYRPAGEDQIHDSEALLLIEGALARVVEAALRGNLRN